MGFFVKGLIIGFVVAVPVGPIGLLCINRAISGRPAYGLFSGLGVSTADAISGGIAVLGLTLVSDFLIAQQVWLRSVGGVFLCYLGLRTFLAMPAGKTPSAQEGSLVKTYASMFFLTFTNPLTILSFVAIYAGWGVENLSGDYVSAAVLTSGVFVGSALWWVILTVALMVYGPGLASPGFRWAHRISGMIIAGFGLVVLLNL